MTITITITLTITIKTKTGDGDFGSCRRKAVERSARMTLISDKDKREQSWRWLANPRFCTQHKIEHQITFSQVLFYFLDYLNICQIDVYGDDDHGDGEDDAEGK